MGGIEHLVLYDHTFSNLSGMERECARTVRSSSKVSNPTFQPLIGSLEPPRIGVVPVINFIGKIYYVVVLLAFVVSAQEWSWHTFPGPQTCRIHIPLPYHELGLPNIDPNNDKGSY